MKQKLLEPPLTAGLAPLHIPYLIAKNVVFSLSKFNRIMKEDM